MEWLVKNILPGAVIAIATAWVTVQLSLKQFRTERWWERKIEAYSDLLGHLHDAKSFAEENMEADYRNKELTEDEQNVLRAKSRKADEEIYRAMDVGAFYLSETAINRLKKFKKDASKATNTTSWTEYLINDYSAADNCLKDMIEIAKNDLKV